jgi:hypothetical protein
MRDPEQPRRRPHMPPPRPDTAIISEAVKSKIAKRVTESMLTPVKRGDTVRIIE